MKVEITGPFIVHETDEIDGYDFENTETREMTVSQDLSEVRSEDGGYHAPISLNTVYKRDAASILQYAFDWYKYSHGERNGWAVSPTKEKNIVALEQFEYDVRLSVPRSFLWRTALFWAHKQYDPDSYSDETPQAYLFYTLRNWAVSSVDDNGTACDVFDYFTRGNIDTQDFETFEMSDFVYELTQR